MVLTKQRSNSSILITKIIQTQPVKIDTKLSNEILRQKSNNKEISIGDKQTLCWKYQTLPAMLLRKAIDHFA